MNRKLVELLEIKLLLNLEQSFILFPGTHRVPIELGKLGALGELGELGELRETRRTRESRRKKKKIGKQET